MERKSKTKSGKEKMIKKEDIEHLCWLARIELSDEEKEKFAAQSVSYTHLTLPTTERV